MGQFTVFLTGKGENDAMRVYTLGYTGLNMAAIKAKLEEVNGVLVDCRFSPFSRAPVWQKASFIRELGPRYIHVKQFGNRNYRPQDAGRGIDLVDPESGIRILEANGVFDVEGGSVVLMCACPESSGCHRRPVATILAEYLNEKGLLDREGITHLRKEQDFADLIKDTKKKERDARAKAVEGLKRRAKHSPGDDDMLTAQQRLRDRALGLPPVGVRGGESETLDMFAPPPAAREESEEEDDGFPF